jgi:hypothetical protein
MNRHTLIPIAGAAAVALALVAGAQARPAGARTLKLHVTATRLSSVDVPPLVTSKTSPETPGDQVIAVSRISGADSGRRFLMCSVTQTAPSIEEALYSCQVTYVLSHGTITASGVVYLSSRKPVKAAITGGTGGYANVRGVLSSLPGADTLTIG